jgi:hypothetical protein
MGQHDGRRGDGAARWEAGGWDSTAGGGGMGQHGGRRGDGAARRCAGNDVFLHVFDYRFRLIQRSEVYFIATNLQKLAVEKA